MLIALGMIRLSAPRSERAEPDPATGHSITGIVAPTGEKAVIGGVFTEEYAGDAFSEQARRRLDVERCDRPWVVGAQP